MKFKAKRQRAAALHDARANYWPAITPSGFGVRLSSAAFSETGPALKAIFEPSLVTKKQDRQKHPTLKGLRQRPSIIWCGDAGDGGESALTLALSQSWERGSTFSGLNTVQPSTQGSHALLRQKHYGGQATLGFVAESLWDSFASATPKGVR